MKKQNIPVIRFMQIESATGKATDYNWDGMMYPAIRLSDMNVGEITPDICRIKAYHSFTFESRQCISHLVKLFEIKCICNAVAGS